VTTKLEGELCSTLSPPPITGKTAFVLGVQTWVAARAAAKLWDPTEERIAVGLVMRACEIKESCFVECSSADMTTRVLEFVGWFTSKPLAEAVLDAAIPDWLEWESEE
jgi:hypothetical protein